MQSPARLRRQAMRCLALAEETHNQRLARQLLEFSEQLAREAAEATLELRRYELSSLWVW
jgi:hypothetical protein